MYCLTIVTNDRGLLFADSDLIGIPHRLVIGERNLNEGMIEYKARNKAESSLLPYNEILDLLDTQFRSF